MEPGIKVNQNVFSSNLVSPDRFDLIVFKRIDSMFGKVKWVYRLCGLPGDTVQIRDGILYVNGVNADTDLNLKDEYFVSLKDADGLITEEDEEAIPTESGDTLIVTMSNSDVLEKGIACRKFLQMSGYVNPEINKAFQQPWNEDHFGPLKVPEGKYFLLGDNRHRAMDSRYIGLVDKKDWVATVLW
jgi:signal peptidase I